MNLENIGWNYNKYHFLSEMKEEIRHWWKTNMINRKIDNNVINILKEIVFHEMIHWRICKTSADNKYLTLELEKAEKEGDFYYNASFIHTYPFKFNLPKYYPRFIFIEFKHFLFDIIWDISKLEIFTTFRYRLFKFLNCLIAFKVRS